MSAQTGDGGWRRPGTYAAGEENEIKAAARDQVVRHENCGRILVRTADSGI
ncbi:hypothetical protein ACWDA9_26595 [Streptomyces sp. NPDC001193]